MHDQDTKENRFYTVGTTELRVIREREWEKIRPRLEALNKEELIKFYAYATHPLVRKIDNVSVETRADMLRNGLYARCDKYKIIGDLRFFHTGVGRDRGIAKQFEAWYASSQWDASERGKFYVIPGDQLSAETAEETTIREDVKQRLKTRGFPLEETPVYAPVPKAPVTSSSGMTPSDKGGIADRLFCLKQGVRGETSRAALQEQINKLLKRLAETDPEPVGVVGRPHDLQDWLRKPLGGQQ